MLAPRVSSIMKQLIRRDYQFKLNCNQNFPFFVYLCFDPQHLRSCFVVFVVLVRAGPVQHEMGGPAYVNCRVQSGQSCIMHRHAFNTLVCFRNFTWRSILPNKIMQCESWRQEQKGSQLSSLCISSNPVRLQFSSFRSNIQMFGSLCHLSPRAVSFIGQGEIQFEGGSVNFNWD